MKVPFARLPVLLCGLLFASQLFGATILVPDAGYYRFGMDAVGAEVVARDALGDLLASDGSPFTFSLAVPGEMIITDLQLSLDQFRVYINDVDFGVTSTPTPGASVGVDVAAALADASFSRGIYQLAPGDYSVRIFLEAGDALPGSGAIGVFTVPEPGTYALIACGLGLILLRRRFVKV
jgi:hypothetical protein